MGFGFRAVPIATVKYSFSKQHFRAAKFFASQASAIEQEAIPVPEARQAEHRAYVTGAVLLSVAALESSINELYHEIISKEKKTIGHLDSRAIDLIVGMWAETERAPILQKYQRALLFSGRQVFDKSASTFQRTDDLIRLRDALVHYKPEWDIEHKPQRGHGNIQKRLRGQFPLNPDAKGVWFPHQCLGAGCAEWATKIAFAFMKEFCDRFGVIQRLP